MKEIANISNMQSFSKNIEEFVKEKKCGYIEAVVLYCDTHNIEIETGAKLLNSIIKKKIEAEASDLNCLTEKTAKLPI